MGLPGKDRTFYQRSHTGGTHRRHDRNQPERVFNGKTPHVIGLVCPTSSVLQEIPENAADLAHLAHLHTPSMTSGVDLRYINSKTWEFLRHDWKVSIWFNVQDGHGLLLPPPTVGSIIDCLCRNETCVPYRPSGSQSQSRTSTVLRCL